MSETVKDIASRSRSKNRSPRAARSSSWFHNPFTRHHYSEADRIRLAGISITDPPKSTKSRIASAVVGFGTAAVLSYAAINSQRLLDKIPLARHAEQELSQRIHSYAARDDDSSPSLIRHPGYIVQQYPTFNPVFGPNPGFGFDVMRPNFVPPQYSISASPGKSQPR